MGSSVQAKCWQPRHDDISQTDDPETHEVHGGRIFLSRNGRTNRINIDGKHVVQSVERAITRLCHTINDELCRLCGNDIHGLKRLEDSLKPNDSLLDFLPGTKKISRLVMMD
jgi:hypothetical protein